MIDSQKYMDEDPVIKKIVEKKETAWINPYYLPFHMTDAVNQLVVSDGDIEDAEKRLERFAPFIQKCFPETEETRGLIESPLVKISRMQETLEEAYECKIPGDLYLKMDSHLAIAGSIKARGGIYEVLKHAEDLAIQSGRFSLRDDYACLAEEEWKSFFGQYTVQVGSTGNLGLSIGIMSAALGFHVKVHMSADAKQWKKDLLRSKGVEVIEYQDDYSRAVAEGRKLSDMDPMSYFVDDEKSVNLFLGYAVAARRLQEQLALYKITVDEKHPLIVYIPAGVGGAPGGVAYGLKRIFKDHVHCFFTEPVLCPSVLLGIATQKFEQANVHDFGIDGITEADGLACASPSGFVTRIMTNLLSGEFTVADTKLYEYLRHLDKSEQIRIEPSSCAAFAGPCGLLTFDDSRNYCKEHGLTEDILEHATQIAWATGGRLVPETIWEQYLGPGLRQSEETQMIQTLLDSGAFEIQKRTEEEGVYDVPYMLNDALECYLVFSGASIKGEFREDLEDEPISGELVEEDRRNGIIIRQGQKNTCTLWYQKVESELALYRHHEIGHFWEEGAWQWRRLVYIIGTMQDKYLFMGEEVCNQEELELIPLMEFSPFHRYFPALSYAPEEYVTTEEGCRLAIRLAKEAKDHEYQFLCWLYLHFPNGFLEQYLHKKLMSSQRGKLYDLLTEKCRRAGMQYPERDYGEEKNALRARMRQELHEKFLQNGFEGIYPNYRKKGVQIQVAEEHPFTRMESFEDGFRFSLMVSELKREDAGFNRGFFKGKGHRGYICSPEEYFPFAE